MKIAEVVSTIGTQHIGFSLGTALNYLDTQVPGGVMGVPIRLIADVVAGIGGIAGGIYLPSPWDLIAPLIGGYVSTDLWRYVAAAVPAGMPLATPGSPVFTPSTLSVASNPEQGRYTVKPEPSAPKPSVKGARYQIVD